MRKDELEAQTTTVGGLCAAVDRSMAPPTILSIGEGKFACYDPQAIVFPNP